jgi:phospholipid/cholesterol/gamma-HCH transport system substrate-binding protein
MATAFCRVPNSVFVVRQFETDQAFREERGSGREVPGFADMQWSDSIPTMLQAKLIQGFENYDITHAPLRPVDGLNADDQLLIDVRNFQIESDPDLTAEIGFSARIVAKDGHVVASRMFQQTSKIEKLDPPSAVAAFNDAFKSIATELITWTADAL